MGKHFDDAVGKGKEAFGKAAGDRGTEAEGKVDQAKANAKDTTDKLKDKAEDAIGSVGDKIKDVFKRD
ncbi:MAG TPA: CsbD family protein [Nocardiopsis listeri]|uniref:CsbD family protein n=1 Tax=Nocardiopsis listeri TaxID=53440 RepID=UPI001DFAA770|nr:CsbD family protein [Nocardiopsis listeri]HJE58343.1 CsbD family protein [Nocardiopsis listeri]